MGLSLVVAGEAPPQAALGLSRWWRLLFELSPRMHQFRGCGACVLVVPRHGLLLDQGVEPMCPVGKQIHSQWTTTEIHAPFF